MEKCSDQRRLDEMIEFPFFSPDDDAHVGEGRERRPLDNLPGWISFVATMESFLPWKTTVQLRITTDYNLNFRNVGFLLWRTRVIEKAGHQVYSGPKMFWC